MLPAVIAYPQIDAVAFSLGPLPIRWYALAYIAGLLLGWAYARKLVRDDRLWGAIPRPDALSLDDLLVYAALGVVAGGRLGYVLFYNPAFYLANPQDIIAVWHGGMSFHGGLAGAALGVLAAVDQAGAFQHLQVFGNRRLAHGEGLGQFVHRGFPRSQPGQDGAAGGVGEGEEGCVEVLGVHRIA